jgi:hypothetical protein
MPRLELAIKKALFHPSQQREASNREYGKVDR